MTKTPTPSGGLLRSNVVSGGLDMEAQRLSQLHEAMARKRSQTTYQKPTSVSSGLKGSMLERFMEGTPTETDEEGDVTSDGEDQIGQMQPVTQQAAMAERLQSLKQMARTKADQMLESGEGKAAKEKIQKEVRKTAKVAIRRGVTYLLDFIAGCFDLGTVGITLIVDIIIYAVTLLDLNIQMIWGYYIAKGKSLFFPALDWTPLKIPLPVIFLHAGLVLLDITLVVLIGTLMLVSMIVMFLPSIVATAGLAGTYKFATDPAFRSILSNMISP